jgi:hypothetical protein
VRVRSQTRAIRWNTWLHNKKRREEGRKGRKNREEERGRREEEGEKENVWLDGKNYLFTLGVMVWAKTLGSFGARYVKKDPEV